MKFFPYASQWINEDDIAAVTEVLRSDWITQGPMIDRFESALASYCGAKYAVAVSSGTAALHLAALAAGILPGDKAVTSPMTFVASANCVLYAGGETGFADIDPATRNISPAQLKKAVAKEAVKAVIPVHFTGLPCEMEEIHELAAEHGFTVIEDACHALGAEYRTKDGEWVKVGSCRHSDMAVFSFHPVKIITTGEGGAITTNSDELYQKLMMLRAHGITKDPDKLRRHDGPWYYEMTELGYNYRLTDFQCALGLAQLTKLDGWLARRRSIAQRYDESFADTPAISIRPARSDLLSAHHLYVIEVDDRAGLFERLRRRGVGSQIHYSPVHLQPYYRDRFGYREGDYPNSEAYYGRCLSVPIYPKMTDHQVDLVVSAVTEEVS